MNRLIRGGYCKLKYIVDINWENLENICGYSVYSPDFLQKEEEGLIVIANAQAEQQEEIRKQLKRYGIGEDRIICCNQVLKAGGEEQSVSAGKEDKERIVSYSNPLDREDIILYHVLHDESDIYYIDVGSADPISCSVTKLLYDVKKAHGINIEPQKNMYELTQKQRSRDINLCVGIGRDMGTAIFYLQNGLSTIIKENAHKDQCNKEEIEIVTLEYICNQYLPKGHAITFLKIDVEGAEESVLRGMNFQRYRPWIVVMESTLPCTMMPCYETWEHILLDNKYHFVYSYGVNRYYVANERAELDSRFINMEDICNEYNVYSVTLERLYK